MIIRDALSAAPIRSDSFYNPNSRTIISKIGEAKLAAD